MTADAALAPDLNCLRCMPDVPPRTMVLLVEDHDLTRRALACLLRFSGFDVRTAVSGHAAIHFLKLFRPDAIVLDLALPDLAGTDVLEWVRQDPFLWDTPVLIFSGDHDWLAATAAIDAQARLPKGSVAWNTLVAEIRRLTKRSDASPPPMADWHTPDPLSIYPPPPPPT